MKKIVWMVFAAIVPLILMADTMNNPQPEPTLKSKYVLTDLWKKYADLSRQDLPKQEAAALAAIRDEALRRKLPLDFWDAAKLYYDTAVSRDWKRRSDEQNALQQYVKDFDDPLVTYFWMVQVANYSNAFRWDFVRKNQERLNGHRPDLYVGLEGVLGNVLVPFIRSDYEYILWHLYRGTLYDYTLSGRVRQALEENLGDSYPGRAFLDYYRTQTISWDTRRPSLEALVQKYEGKAAALFPRADLLGIDKRVLDGKASTAGEYKDLYARCQQFVSDARKFKGDEAVIAKARFSTYGLMDELTSTGIHPSVEGRDILVVFRNLEKADVTLSTAGVKRPKTLYRWKKVKNPVQSFYVKDTVRIALPSLPDGEYQILATSGADNESRTGYSQHRLSLAIRLEEAGPCAYVADYRSGQPLEKATLVLWNGSERVCAEKVDLDGFTLLPAKIRKKLQNDEIFWTLSAETGSGTDYRSSEPLSLPYSFDERGYWNGNDGIQCNLYKDQGAYNPGNTLRYKVVLYQGNLVDQASVLAGKQVKVELRDPEGKTVGGQELTTNEFGSASGSFLLPKDRRNGSYSLIVRQDHRYLLFDRVTVDEFVLPTFSLDFDDNNQLYAPGDTVEVGGVLKSFSGHTLTETKLETRVTCGGHVPFEQVLEPDKEGRFAFRFKAKETGRYLVEVRAVDATGETQEFHTSLYVSDNLHVGLELENAVAGSFTLMEEQAQPRGRRYYVPPHYGMSRHIVTENRALVNLKVSNNEGELVPVPVKWTLIGDDKAVIASGTGNSGETVSIGLDGVPSGVYTLQAEARDRKAHDEQKVLIQLLRKTDTVLGAQVRRVFIPGESNIPEGGDIRFRMGAADGAEWAIVTLFGKNRKVLETRRIFLSGEAGAEGSLTDLVFPYKESYPDAVRLHVFYFKHGESIEYERQYSRIRTRLILPLAISRFQDKLYPDTEYSFSLKTAPSAEAVVAVYDKSLDAIASNDWRVVSLREFSLPSVCLNSVCGSITGKDPYGADIEEEASIAEYESAAAGQNAAMAKGMALRQEPMMARSVMEDAAGAAADEAVPEVKIRSKFETALAFLPHLRSDAAGNIDFSFRTSDKLSTYYLAVYAHDAAMRNAFCRQEMVVSVPVKVAVTEPRFLYRGDSYQLAAALSSLSDQAVEGALYLSLYDGAEHKGVEPFSVQKVPVTVPAGGVVNHRFDVKVPEGVETLGIKVVFAAEEFSDGVFLPVPVLPDSQVLTEAHSAVFRPSQTTYDALVARLRKAFVNGDGAKADLSEITVLGMVKDAIPGKVEPQGKDVLSVSEAWYMRLMASRLEGGLPLDGSEEKLLQKVMECQGGDGGFAWFQGMKSSPVITAVLLERFAKLRARGFQVPDLKRAVQFLDQRHFSLEEPLWCGALSDEQYMYIRSLYPEVPFEVKPSAQDEKKRMTAFKKDAKAYLVPAKADGRGLKGQILAKGRRLATLRNLSATDAGVKLAAAWGVTFAAKAKLDASLSADLQSLLEYAIEHRDGGWYYPNAVMPWRGLMESEAYAHSLLCDLFASMRATAGAKPEQVAEAEQIADGIRLWLMLQKETQHWDTEPVFVDAITSIMDGSEEVLGTKVVILKSTFEIPFTKVKAAGNGFRISRRFFREQNVDGKRVDEEIRPGTLLHVGDKIRAEYRIWNGENRSFVKIDAFREATLQPVQQLSGHLGWGFIPYISYGRGFSFGPQGYRNVKADRTEYYFDAFPEEYTTLTEEFFVQQAGSFAAPVLTVESLYAPHYRANSAASGVMKVAAK